MTPEAIARTYAASFNNLDTFEPTPEEAFEAGYRAGLREAIRKVNTALNDRATDAVRIMALYAIADTIEREAGQ